jgi:hypothetical protein
MAYKYPIVLACHIWGHAWLNKRIKFWCNNQSVVHITHSGTSTDDKIMHLVHTLFLITAKFNFCVVLHTSPVKQTRLLAPFHVSTCRSFSISLSKLIPHQWTYQRGC